MVDATDEHIGFAVEDLVDGQLHAVDGCSGGFVRLHARHAKVVRRHAQDVADGDGVPHATLVAVRGDHDDIP